MGRIGRMPGAGVVVRVAVAVALTAGTATAVTAQERALDWSESMRSGDVLEVKNITGDIRVVMARGSTAEVVAEKQGRSRDFDRIHVVVEESRDGFTICAIYDRPDRDSCDQRGDWDDERDDDNRSLRASIDFEVRLPAGVELIGSTVTGDVTVRDVESDVTANTVTGDVEVSTTGVARANNVSGSIDVRMDGTRWDDLSFHTVSGDITVSLPAGIDTEVDFKSLSGDFDSDFDVTAERSRRRFLGSRLEGTIGSGGRTLSLETVSGDVRLLRR